MPKYRVIVKEIFSCAASYAVALNLVAVIYYLIYPSWLPLTFYLTLIPFVLMYVVRKTVVTLLRFVLYHGAIIGGAVLLIPEGGNLMWALLCVGTLLSFSRRVRGEKELTGRSAVSGILTFAVMFVMVVQFGRGDVSAMQAWVTVWALLPLVCHIMYIQMSNLDYRLAIARRTDAAVTSANNRMAATFSITFIAVFAVIGLFFAGVITFRRSEIPDPPPVFGHHTLFLMPDEHLSEDFSEAIMYQEGIPELGDIFDQEARIRAMTIVFYSLAIPTIILIVAGLAYSFYIQFRKLFAKGRDGRADEDVLVESIAGGFFSDMRSIFRRPVRLHPIRRAYYKKIKKKIGIPQNRDTTESLLIKIRPEEDISELTARYEQIRYGNTN